MNAIERQQQQTESQLLFEQHVCLLTRFRRTSYYGEVLIALWKAALDFDPTYGLPFEAWAKKKIRYAVVEELRARQRTPRRAYEAGLMVASYDAMNERYSRRDWRLVTQETPESLLLLKERAVLARAEVAAAEAGVPQALLQAVLNDEEHQEIAIRHGISKSWASRLYVKGLRIMSKRPKLRALATGGAP